MSSGMFDVVVVGSCNIDLISYVPRFPKAGETLCGTKFVTGCGGKGANQCVMAAKLGGQTAMVGCVGDDNFGDMYKNNFSSLNVNTECLFTIKDMTTGVAPITVNEEGENSIVIVKGANDYLNQQHLQQADKVIDKAAIVLCQLEIDLEITLSALKMAHERGIPTLFNPAPAIHNLSPDYLKNTTILCCNETEAEILSGLKVVSTHDQEAVVELLLQKGPEYVVLTLGAQGAMFGVKKDNRIKLVKPDQGLSKVVDTTGAGDCFVGTLAYFFAKRPDLDFSEKVKRAVTIASISVGKPGTQTSYPTADKLPANLI